MSNPSFSSLRLWDDEHGLYVPATAEDVMVHLFQRGKSDPEIRECLRPFIDAMTNDEYHAFEVKLDDLHRGWDEIAMAYRKAQKPDRDGRPAEPRPTQASVAAELIPPITETALRNRIRGLGVDHYDYVHVRMKRERA
jgi:hypothetical protein